MIELFNIFNNFLHAVKVCLDILLEKLLERGKDSETESEGGDLCVIFFTKQIEMVN